MGAPWFIGDELTGAGFRLAGAHVVTIDMGDPEGIGEAFRRALGEASLVVITTPAAALLPESGLARAVIAANPPVAVVPDARDTAPMPDMGVRVRRALGVES
jgi:vacuolar-type H+-ATPase subunit F/Vma7